MRAFSQTCVIFITAALVGCAAPYTPTKTALELQAIQAKEFECTKQQAFAATLSVFQDLGYIVTSASLDTGVISAKSPTAQDFVPSLSAFYFSARMRDRKATAFVEEIAKDRTKVRLNFVDSTQISSSSGRSEKDLPVESPELYQDTFTKIQQGIFFRKNVQ